MIKISKGESYGLGNEYAFGLYWTPDQQFTTAQPYGSQYPAQPAFGQPQQFGHVQQPQGYPQPQQGIPGTPHPVFDLDFWVLRLHQDGRVRSDDDVVYHNDRFTQDGTIQLSQDNLDGSDRQRLPGQRDDEFVIVRGSLGASTARIIVAIHEAEKRQQHFGQLAKAGVNVYNSANFAAGADAHFDLDKESRWGTVVTIGDVRNGQFMPLGHTHRNLDPNQPALPQVLRAHGVNV